MPIDLTDRIQQFRHAGHQLGDAPSPDDLATLFRALVMYPLPPDAAAVPATTEGEVLNRYRVYPAAAQTSALVSTDIPAAGTWDHPVTLLEASAVDLRLVSFFDWETAGTRDLQFLRVRIVHANDPSLVGRDALLETSDCRVEYVD
ncbi:hypothetical protein OKA05_26295 [Luteolibacter arcticus]|uniref:Uncharacterized protein n=1 Tax=Luteolibacter arcticus TaxID=1581411 RepID=A0ABT3GRE1_9BACT|nr:hypothetical protein [Luteolibacter arcticus]MCW1926097.1 hypothetical protein [Luteolibacter arcticus]